jgi:hypothetical protein
MSEQLSTIREQIAALKIEQAVIVAQPVCRDAVAQAVRDGVKDCESISEAQTLQTLQRMAAGQPAPLLHVQAGPVAINLLPLFIRLMGTAAVTKALLRGLDKIPEGLAQDTRAKRLTAITTELRSLERSEETLIRQSGETIPRRGDADPAIVLAL